MRRPLLALALSLSLYGTATAGPVISTLAEDPIVATGITGLELPGMPGVLYAVDFTRANESFNAIFGTGDPPSGLVPTFYNDPTGAEAMRDAIQVLFDGTSVARVGNSETDSNYFDIPTRSTPFNENNYITHYARVGAGGGTRGSSVLGRTSNEGIGLGVFTVAVVPEPSSVTLALMGAMGLLGYGWRRKRKRANAVS